MIQKTWPIGPIPFLLSLPLKSERGEGGVGLWTVFFESRGKSKECCKTFEFIWKGLESEILRLKHVLSFVNLCNISMWIFP